MQTTLGCCLSLLLLAACGQVASSPATDASSGSDAPTSPTDDGSATDASAPDTTTSYPSPDAGFTCDALPTGAAGGCPPIMDMFCDDGGPPQPGHHAPCTDAAFGGDHRWPIGCNVTLPSDSPYYPGSGQLCLCTETGGDGGMWSCPL